MSEEQQNILIEAMEQATLYQFELLGAQAAEVYGGVGTILYDL